MGTKFPKNITQYRGDHEINGYSFSIPTITAEDKAFVKAAKRNKGIKSCDSKALHQLMGDVILNGNMARLLWALDVIGWFGEPYFAGVHCDTIPKIFQCLTQQNNDLPDDLLDKLKLIYAKIERKWLFNLIEKENLRHFIDKAGLSEVLAFVLCPNGYYSEKNMHVALEKAAQDTNIELFLWCDALRPAEERKDYTRYACYEQVLKSDSFKKTLHDLQPDLFENEGVIKALIQTFSEDLDKIYHPLEGVEITDYETLFHIACDVGHVALLQDLVKNKDTDFDALIDEMISDHVPDKAVCQTLQSHFRSRTLKVTEDPQWTKLSDTVISHVQKTPMGDIVTHYCFGDQRCVMSSTPHPTDKGAAPISSMIPFTAFMDQSGIATAAAKLDEAGGTASLIMRKNTVSFPSVKAKGGV